MYVRKGGGKKGGRLGRRAIVPVEPALIAALTSQKKGGRKGGRVRVEGMIVTKNDRFRGKIPTRQAFFGS